MFEHEYILSFSLCHHTVSTKKRIKKQIMQINITLYLKALKLASPEHE